MLVRICLILAIIAGLAVGGLNFVMVKEKITTLQTNLKTETEAHKKFETDFHRTKSELDKTNAVLKATQETLKVTEEEKTKAVAEAANQTKRADKLNDDLVRTRGERDGAQSELSAYKAAGMTPEQILNANKVIKTLQDNLGGSQDENKLLGQKISNLENQLAKYTDPDRPVTLPSGLTGKVLVSDPKWHFVVLNVGADQKVLERAELLINRDGKLVAKVKVASVQKDRCVCNVIP